MKQVVHTEREFALIIRQAPDPPPVMLVYLRLLLNHLYGLEILNGQKLPDVASLVMEHGHSVRSIFLIQNEEISSRNTISALSQRGNLPVVLVMPPHLAQGHVAICQGMKNVFICDWDRAVGNADTSLQTIVAGAFEAQGIVKLPTDDGELPHGLLKKRIQQRLKFGDTLPTLPEIVLRITQMLADPRTTADDLEEVVSTDHAIVHRLLHVVKSSVFQGTRTDGHWTLKEAIVRLGSKQVGAVAQQVKLINSLVRPENSQFNIRRFWEHSVGCAIIADKLYADKLIPMNTKLEFDLYWIAALLHDVGKLILGFFAWDYFQAVIARMREGNTSFQRAEERLGHEVTHEHIGQLLMLNSDADKQLVQVVGNHNSTGAQPTPLVSLIHVADNLAKDFGMGYLEDERGIYNSSVLVTLGIARKDIDSIRASMGDSMVREVREIVSRCLRS